jgi:hypothetical protein
MYTLNCALELTGDTIVGKSVERGRTKRPAPVLQDENTPAKRSKGSKKQANKAPLPGPDPADAEFALIQVPPAPKHLQWGVSACRAPPGTTPIVPSQAPLVAPAREKARARKKRGVT